jgi:hypothetical protein
MFVLKAKGNGAGNSLLVKKGLFLAGYFVALRLAYYASTKYLSN